MKNAHLHIIPTLVLVFTLWFGAHLVYASEVIGTLDSNNVSSSSGTTGSIGGTVSDGSGGTVSGTTSGSGGSGTNGGHPPITSSSGGSGSGSQTTTAAPLAYGAPYPTTGGSAVTGTVRPKTTTHHTVYATSTYTPPTTLDDAASTTPFDDSTLNSTDDQQVQAANNLPATAVRSGASVGWIIFFIALAALLGYGIYRVARRR
jgi:hypothetical protein